MQLFHWPILGALQGIAVLSAPALFAMAGFAPDLTIEIASTEAEEEAEDIIELAEDAVEVADAAEEAAEELEDEVDEAEELEEAVEEAVEIEEAVEEVVEEEEAAEEIEEAVEETEDSEPTCWITPSGSLYHLDPDCTYIRNKDALTELSIEEAESADRRPCSRCAQ